MNLESPNQPRTIAIRAAGWIHQPGGRCYLKLYANIDGPNPVPIGDLTIDAPNPELAQFLIKSARDFLNSQRSSIVVPTPVLEKAPS